MRASKVLLLAITVASVLLFCVSGIVTFADSHQLRIKTSNALSGGVTNVPSRIEVLSTPAISVTAGSNQIVPIHTSFPTQLQVIVTDSGVPQSAIEVTFSAPTDGASGTFEGGESQVTVFTDSQGTATAPLFTANGIAGSYQISATIPEAATAFDLTNAQGDQTIDFPAIAAKTYGDPPFSVSATASSGLRSQSFHCHRTGHN